MVYLKVPKGNEAREDTTFIHIRNRYSVLNMQYSFAKYNFFLLLSLLLYESMSKFVKILVRFISYENR